jgi:hypothetical protein
MHSSEIKKRERLSSNNKEKNKLRVYFNRKKNK